MAAIASPFKFTYGSQAVGGSSGTFQVDGAYTTSANFNEISFSFAVVVVASSFADLQNQSDTLEAAFRKRDQTFLLDLDNIADPAGASLWTFTINEDILHTTASAEKIGDEESDNGFSRTYVLTVRGGLPSTDIIGEAGAHLNKFTGLREISFAIAYTSSRQKRITFSGVYTATPAQSSPSRSAALARANYENANTGADDEVSLYLAANFPSPAVFELVSEDVKEDRTNNVITFNRVYVEQLEDQVVGTRDAANIRDHSFTFSETIDQPGDSSKNVNRIREVVGRYNCAIDIDNTTDPETVFRTEIRPQMKALFVSEFNPAQYAVRHRDVNYDRTAMRISATMTFLYQKSGGEAVVQLRSTVEIDEASHHDFTPMHENNPFAMELDKGWTMKTRTTTVDSMVIGSEKPKPRITPNSGGQGERRQSQGGKGGGGAGESVTGGSGGDTSHLGGSPESSGNWVTVRLSREASSVWIGDPDEPQMLATQLSEVHVEQYFEFPKGRVARKF